jgi:hypothetical protein
MKAVSWLRKACLTLTILGLLLVFASGKIIVVNSSETLLWTGLVMIVIGFVCLSVIVFSKNRK